jgi:hypothetical protein
MSDDQRERETAGGWRERLGDVIGGLRGLPFARDVEQFLQGELNRLLRLPESGRMNANTTRGLAIQLYNVLNGLAGSCRTEQGRLEGGRGFMGIGRRDPSDSAFDSALATFFTIAYQYQQALLEHLKQAKRQGSPMAQALVPQDDTTLRMPGVVGLTPAFLSEEQRRDLVERMRGVYRRTLADAAAIQQDLSGANATNQFVYHTALSKAVALANRLTIACTELVRTFAPDIAPPPLFGALPAAPGDSAPALPAPTSPVGQPGSPTADPASGAVPSPAGSGANFPSPYDHYEMVITGPRTAVRPPSASQPLPAWFAAYVRRELPIEQLCMLYIYAYQAPALPAIQADAQQDWAALGDQPIAASAQAAVTIPTGGELTFVPSFGGIQVSPSRAAVRWGEQWQRLVFNLRAERALAGTSRQGEITVYGGEHGDLVIARIELVLRFAGA